MRELLPRLTASLHLGRPVAVCRLVETHGSTPQKSGAAMLVFADGSQAGTLGGGCVEVELKRRALGVLARGTAEIVKFQLDDNYGWDDGLIGGSRMQVLVDPIAESDARDYYLQLAELADAGRGATEVIVFDENVSGLNKTACCLFDDAGELLRQLRIATGEGPGLAAVRANIRSLAERPKPAANQGIAYLPMLERCRLVIVGGGQVGQAVGNLAAELDFDVWIVDDRAEYVTAERFPLAERRIAGVIGEVLPALEITPKTYCLIVTRDHSHDEEALYHLVDRGARYVGMIGSKRKIKLIFDDLLGEGVSAESLRKVYAPVGLDIGSQTVMEIAVSIVAELVAYRNLGVAGHRTRERLIAHEP